MGFFDLLIELFSRGVEPSKNKRLLKQVAQDLKRNRYHKFYKPRTGEITQAAEMFFYDLYKNVAIAQGFIKNADKSAILKQITVEAFMDKELRDLYDRLSPENIERQGKNLSPQDLSKNIQSDMQTFARNLENKAQGIDRCYQLIMLFSAFVGFDFFSLLKKIDSRMPEHQFSYPMQYRPVNARYVVENIKDFLDLTLPEGTADEWQKVFEVLKKYKGGKSPMELNQWRKLIGAAHDLRRSGMLVLMVKHSAQDPFWDAKPQITFYDSILDGYLKVKRAEVEAALKKLAQDKQSAKRDSLIKRFFGGPAVIRLQFYTNTANEEFTDKNLDGYTHIQELNYLKLFLLDHHDIQDLCDLFLIHGKWATPEVSKQISQELHDMTGLLDQITAFDESLGDTGQYGSRLRLYLKRYGFDKSQIANLKVTLKLVNGRALEIVTGAITAFSKAKQNLQDLHERYKQGKTDFVVNWKELESLSDTPLGKRLENGYTIIEEFAHLLELFTLEEDED